jgi:hypothetical protein
MRARLLLLPILAALLSGPPPAMAQGGDPSFNLVNRTGQAINEIYVSPTREQFWGRDLLGNDTLANGRAFPVRIAPAAGCQQDVRVVFADGRNEERRNQNTCTIAEMVFGSAAAAPPPVASGANPSFNLVNHGRAPIREVYVSSARDTHWGEDRLGADILPPGRHLEVRLPQGDCVNDVRIVWMDGRDEERRATDTCRLTNLIFR